MNKLPPETLLSDSLHYLSNISHVLRIKNYKLYPQYLHADYFIFFSLSFCLKMHRYCSNKKFLLSHSQDCKAQWLWRKQQIYEVRDRVKNSNPYIRWKYKAVIIILMLTCILLKGFCLISQIWSQAPIPYNKNNHTQLKQIFVFTRNLIMHEFKILVGRPWYWDFKLISCLVY